MDANLINISSVQTYLDGILRKSGVSKNIYYSNLPKVIAKSWNDMVLVDVNVNDLWGAGKGFVNFFLYSKPIGSDQQNVKNLGRMENVMNDVLSNSRNEHYFLTKFSSNSDYDQFRNLHYIAVTAIIQII